LHFTGNNKKIDLAVTNELALDVLLGNGDGTFSQRCTTTRKASGARVPVFETPHGATEVILFP
jgi:hypothetical protein